MIKLLLTFGLFLGAIPIQSTSIEGHKFYLSLSLVEFNQQTNNLEISLKVFTHDLERCVGRKFRENLNLAEADEHPQSDSLISAYIAEKLIFACGETPQKHQWVGKEVIVDETWCYFEVPIACADSDRISVSNRLFLEVFDQQLNMMKFSAPGLEKQNLDLNARKDSGTFQLP